MTLLTTFYVLSVLSKYNNRMLEKLSMNTKHVEQTMGVE